MKGQHDDYLDGKLTVTHEAIMASAKAKMDYLKVKGKWRAKSPDDEKIVAIAAEINVLKGQLKLNPKLSTNAKEGKKNENKSDKGEKGKKWKNKKNTSNKKDQKRDETWKQVPPKENEKKEKQVGKYTNNWCEHHMAWTVHKPFDCELGKYTRTTRRRTATRPTLPLSPQQPPPPSALVTRPSWPLLQTSRKNDGLHQHAFGMCC
jgi:hypothetical protein